MKLKAIAVSFGAFTCIAMANAPAFAVDGKVHPGSMCQPSDYSDASGLSTGGGFMKNIGSVAKFVTCPVIRDNVTNTNGISRAKMVVYNSQSGSTTYCYLYSRSPSGGYIESEYSGVWTGVGHYTWNMDLDSSADRGLYYFSCYLSPGARVTAYTVDEF